MKLGVSVYRPGSLDRRGSCKGRDDAGGTESHDAVDDGSKEIGSPYGCWRTGFEECKRGGINLCCFLVIVSYCCDSLALRDISGVLIRVGLRIPCMCCLKTMKKICNLFWEGYGHVGDDKRPKVWNMTSRGIVNVRRARGQEEEIKDEGKME